MEIGIKIREARKAANLTQKQLAEKSGIIETTIRKYEIGKQNPKFENVEKIAAALEISPSELMPNKKWQGLEEQERVIREYFAFEEFLKKLGYSVSAKHEALADTTLTKDGKAAIFNHDEYMELQNALNDVIETRFYKKIMGKGRR